LSPSKGATCLHTKIPFTPHNQKSQKSARIHVDSHKSLYASTSIVTKLFTYSRRYNLSSPTVAETFHDRLFPNNKTPKLTHHVSRPLAPPSMFLDSPLRDPVILRRSQSDTPCSLSSAWPLPQQPSISNPTTSVHRRSTTIRLSPSRPRQIDPYSKTRYICSSTTISTRPILQVFRSVQKSNANRMTTDVFSDIGYCMTCEKPLRDSNA
jgi:hypothetical protein